MISVDAIRICSAEITLHFSWAAATRGDPFARRLARLSSPPEPWWIARIASSEKNCSLNRLSANLEVEAAAVIEIHDKSIPEACRAVWKYNERAQMENLIKELKIGIGIGMEHMPCNGFEANAMYFSIGVVPYNLMVAQKYFVIQEGLERSTIGTLRWKLLQIPAWIVDHGNRVRLKIATTVEKFNQYLRMMKRMEAIAALPC